MHSDELALTGLECWGHHGVFEHERREGQAFVIDPVSYTHLTLPTNREV